MKSKINSRQRAVLDELFCGEANQQEILEKYRVKKSEYEKWLCQEHFISNIAERIRAEYLSSAVLLARYAPLAAARLIALTESDKPETARRACLDIIQMGIEDKKTLDAEETMDEGGAALSDEAAGRILAVLAQGAAISGHAESAG